MDLKKRLGIISKIVSKQPGLGKTAMMKYIFLLQKIYKMPLGYNFEIYTYGPYSSEVMEDIDFAKQQSIVSIDRIAYPNGLKGYSIEPTDKLDSILEQESQFIAQYKEAVDSTIEAFGDRNAKELELLTTIIYLYSTYRANNWPMEEIPSNVHDIKPHFDIKTIREELHNLDTQGILELAV
mgnify:CR=1 FL=1